MGLLRRNLHSENGVWGAVPSPAQGRRSLRRVFRIAAVLLAIEAGLGVAGVALFAWSGIYDVAATAGHWEVTRWFLHLVMKNSVAFHAIERSPPRPANVGLVTLGAANFQTSCAPCHGAPGNPPAPAARGMTPTPPPLYSAARDFEPGELHWIVKHGIKMTAMPAWPSQVRDDEIWAMVAFLEKLPELRTPDYLKLALGPASPAAGSDETGLAALDRSATPLVANCAACHGADGAGRGGAAPRIGGQSAAYIELALAAYQDGSRQSGFMQPAVAGLSPADMKTIAGYFARQRPVLAPKSSAVNPDLVARGEIIARLGVPANAVLPCNTCHQTSSSLRSPTTPGLAGQYEGYLLDQLALFSTGIRGGGPPSQVMGGMVHRLEVDDAKAVAAYFAGLEPTPAEP